MYGIPGRAYIYFIYGMHWMLNVVAEPEGTPAAVLIRAILPSEGLAFAEPTVPTATRRDLRFQPTNGPGRLCKALNIDGRLNGVDLTDGKGSLFVEPGQPLAEGNVIQGPRVGIDGVPEPWRSKPWRFRIDGTKWTEPGS
jgi:DNA-3-methyladenine glycosylase